MAPVHVLWLLLALPAQSHPARVPDRLPPDWPPIPDFRTPVNYKKWWSDREERLGPDASPLWEELRCATTAPAETRDPCDEAWGRDPQGVIQGLFTGLEGDPDRYAWDPLSHPKWEEAVRRQDEHGLYERLIKLSRYSVCRLLSSSRSPPLDGVEDPGLWATASLPSLAAPRAAAQVLLQRAWRAPGGQVDIQRMSEAIEAALRIARQLDRRAPARIPYVVALGIRGRVYDSAVHLLQESSLSPDELVKLAEVLHQHDADDLTTPDIEAFSLAGCLDLVQYIYPPAPRVPGAPPMPNMQNVERLAAYLNAAYEKLRLVPGVKPPDFSKISEHSAEEGVRQAVELFVSMQRLRQTRLPQDAGREGTLLIESLVADAKTHPVLRNEVHPSLSRFQVLGAHAEAKRRATQLLYRLHQERAESGRWPATLRAVRRLPPRCRIDPFSGKEFIYRVEGESMTLYSVATNGQDDGGVHDSFWGEAFEDGKKVLKPADYVFWPLQ